MTQLKFFLKLLFIHLARVAALNQTNSNSTWDGDSTKPNATFCSGGPSENNSFKLVVDIPPYLPNRSVAYYDADDELLKNI